MKITENPTTEEIKILLKRPSQNNNTQIRKTVLEIIEKVKENGNTAIKEFSKKFDDVILQNLTVSKDEFNKAEKNTGDELKSAVKTASKNIFKFHEAQKVKIKKIETAEGIYCWQKNVPIEKIGLYVPGGSSPLFSTLLMLAIPAKIAGCKEIIVCTPPKKNGEIDNSILYVAKQIGIEKIFKVGGAQAIAAMAYGTEAIPRVNKIFGPGNIWVTIAKQIVNSSGVAIDMPAGPSEVLIIADSSANSKFIAADLLSQAEHGADSQVILITTSKRLIEAVLKDIETLKKQLPRRKIIEQSLNNSIAIFVNNLQKAIKISNYYAPEHLIIATDNAEQLSEKVINAGSVFIGNYSPEAVGDYASGTNHTLPTNGYASAYSGLSLNSFMKQITFQHLTKKGLQKISKTVQTMAKAEGLDAHKLAVQIRDEAENV